MKAMELIQITEGKAKLMVPKESFNDAFHLPVFYNPAMRFNRSISSLAMRSCRDLFEEDFTVLDGLSSLGSRGIRYAMENKVKAVHFVDANPDALKVLKKNIKLNKLKNAHVAEMDLNKFLLTTATYFDFIEIDPFGSPVFFLQNAIRKLRKKAILSITATDLANLAGANQRPCIKHYDSKPLRCEYAHEVALRILLGRTARDLMMQDFGCHPMLSFFKGHAIKCIVLAEKSAAKADEIIPNLGFIMHCHKCLNRETGKRTKEKCPNCGESYDFAGELWIGKMQDGEMIGKMQKENGKSGFEGKGNGNADFGEKQEIAKMLELLNSENDFGPSFFDIHTIAKKLTVRAKKTAKIMALLEKKGMRTSPTHYSPTSFKTDAKLVDVLKAVK
ncbi:MAG: tRNA (guanine(10)-N(2))-dimethyltransferase [Candidatus Micrarchaeota archaeon]